MQVTERFLTAWTAAEPAGGTGAPEPGSPSAALPPARWGSPCRSRRGLPAAAHVTAPTRTAALKRCVGPRSVRTPRSDRAPTAAAATRATRSRSYSRHMVLASNVGGRPLAAIHMSFIVGTRGRPTHLRPRRQPAARPRRRGMSALDGQTALVTGSVALAAGRPATPAVALPPCPQLRRRPPQSP